MSATCRACRAPVEWAATERGKRIMLDLPSADPKANIIVTDGVAHVVKPGEGTRISHWATCPDAARFRKPKGRVRP